MFGRRSYLLVIGLATLAGCGERDERDASAAPTARPSATGTATAGTAAAERPAAGVGTRIVVRRSEFGSMLFDSRRQAIYIFELDRKNKTVCYGECAKAWPPVYTKARPRAGKGVRSSLLGTIKRRDGRRQVTYAGKPLYFYAHEEPGQVLCHNVNLNGGLWWVVGPDGRRRP